MRYAGAIPRHSESTTYVLYETPRRESKTEQGDDRKVVYLGTPDVVDTS